MHLREVETSPLGETLRRARLNRGITVEEAERVTRIPRKYLEALELENYGILPAPVFARGFLRSYAGYLGLDAGQLMPFFPVGHVEEPNLEPLPEVKETHTWNMSGLIGVGVIGALVLVVVLLYTVARDHSTSLVRDTKPSTQTSGQNAPIIVPPASQAQGPAVALPDLTGQTLEQAIAVVQQAGASFVIVSVHEQDVPSGQVVAQNPAAGTAVGPGNTVTLTTSR